MKFLTFTAILIMISISPVFSQKQGTTAGPDIRMTGLWILDVGNSDLGVSRMLYLNRTLQISVVEPEVTIVTIEMPSHRLISRIVLFSDNRGETNNTYAPDPKRQLKSKTRLKKGVLVRDYQISTDSDLSHDNYENVAEEYSISKDGNTLTITESTTSWMKRFAGKTGPDSVDVIRRVYQRSSNN